MIHKSLKNTERKFSYLSQVSSDIFSDSILSTRNNQPPIRTRIISTNYKFYQHTCFDLHGIRKTRVQIVTTDK